MNAGDGGDDGILRSIVRVVKALVRLVAVVVVAGVGTAAVGMAAVPQVARLVTAHDSTS